MNWLNQLSLYKDSQWLEKPQKSYGQLSRHLDKMAAPTTSFHALTLIASLIGALALIGDNAASLIGAMIVAPLMGPIMATAFGLVTGDLLLGIQGFITSSVGAIEVIFIAWVLTSLMGLPEIGTQIALRTNPTLLDLGIAIAAGAVGALGQSQRSIAATLAGVAIAVALVPPLSVMGMSLSVRVFDLEMCRGATLLFLANWSGMILAAAGIFLIQGYGQWQRAKSGLALILLLIFALTIPLGFSLLSVFEQARLHQQVEQAIARQWPQDDARLLSVRSTRQQLSLKLEIHSGEQLQKARIRTWHYQLERDLGKPTQLEVLMVPIQRFELNSQYHNSLKSD